MRQIPNLDVHITHDCNFQCESCAHSFMQHKFRGTHVSLDVMESWYKDWYQRIEPKSIGLLGGEFHFCIQIFRRCVIYLESIFPTPR